MRRPIVVRCAVLSLLTVFAHGVPAASPERVSLFDGNSLEGWTTRDGKPMTQGWVVEDLCIYRADRGGDLFTAKGYGDFIFEFEWKVAPKSNSGVKYRYTQYGSSWNGPEYQVLDDAGHPDAQLGRGTRKAACLYDILAADTADVYRQPGAWNQGKIVARGSKVEHWLNGKLVLAYDADTPAFKEAVQGSKFMKNPDYASRPAGRIMLQDHNDPVWYRNLFITELSD